MAEVLASDLMAVYDLHNASDLMADPGEPMKNEVKLQFRLPAEVRDWFKAYAEQRSRSMNGQMIELLRDMMAAANGKAPNA